MWPFELGLLLLLLWATPCVQGIVPTALQELWAPLVAPDKECPRYILVNLGKDGMGDQLERLSMGLALATKHKGFTITVSEPLGHSSLHDKKGSYVSIYHDVLGLPIFSRLSDVLARHSRNSWKMLKRRTLKQSEYLAYLRGEADMLSKEPCHALLDVDVYDVCNSWCPFSFGWEVQTRVKPLLRASFALAGRDSCSKHSIHGNSQLMKSASMPAAGGVVGGGDVRKLGVVSVVWHIRRPVLKTDEAQISCRTCSDGYFKKVLNILSKITSSSGSGKGGARNATLFHTIVTNVDKGSQRAAQEHRSYQAHFGTNFSIVMGDLHEAVCTALTADILISTGSTFSSALALFSPRHKPLLLEEQRHTKHVTDHQLKWFTDASDSYHLADGELILPVHAAGGEGGSTGGGVDMAAVLQKMREQLQVNGVA